MRLIRLFLVGALLCAALAQEEEGPVRGRGRGRARLISRQRLADVIEDAVAIEDSGVDGRKRVILRRPGGARRRVKVVRRPRPEPQPEVTEPPATTAEITTPEPPITTFAPSFQASFATSPLPVFSPEPQARFREPEPRPQPQLPRQRAVPARRPAIPDRPAPTTSPRRQQASSSSQGAGGGRQINRKEEVVGTIRNYSYYNEDGSFTFGYEAEDGSFKEETRGTDCVVRGKYGYIDPDGVRREFTYESGNPCDETATEGALQFDDQGFPILDEDGVQLEGGVDPLDDQPIRRPNTQFISQTKEESLSDDELTQFRVSRRRRPQAARRPVLVEEPQPQVEEQQVDLPAFDRRPRPSFVRRPEPQPLPAFRPEPQPLPAFRPEPEPEPQTTSKPEPTTFRPPATPPRVFSPQPEPERPRPPVTFRPVPTTRPEPQRPRPPVTFRPAPTPFSPRPQTGSTRFSFDEELRNLQSRPTSAPVLRPQRPLDADDPDLRLTRPSGPVAGNFEHQLVFDPNSGKHRTDLRQTLPEGTEIRIGEHLNSFSNRPTTTTPRPTPPPSFQNTVFQSFDTRFTTTPRPPPPPPPPTTPPTSRRPVFSVFNQPRPQPQFSQPPPPQGFQQRPQPFTVFNNRPRPPPPPPQQFSTFSRPQSAVLSSSSASSSASTSSTPSGRPVQQVSFGTQVSNPVFARFGVPQPFAPFNGPRPQPQNQGQFRPPQPINFFGNQ